MGAHVVEHEGIQGVSFTVWAPNASKVAVVGEFNFWDGRRHVMQNIDFSGYWHIFISWHHCRHTFINMK